MESVRSWAVTLLAAVVLIFCVAVLLNNIGARTAGPDTSRPTPANIQPYPGQTAFTEAP